MSKMTAEPVWKERLSHIPSKVGAIKLPDAEATLDQDEEWCEVTYDGRRRRIRFHDYNEVYEVPGLYERIFYETLKCNSPTRVSDLLEDVVGESNDSFKELRVLDVGAGNGMVGDELDQIGVDKLVGIDIIQEAKEATDRDRPGLYDDYFVADLTDLSEQDEQKLRRYDFNCLTSVAALGYGDIPPAAFLKALDLLETPSWLAFNIKVSFLHERDTTGFCRLIRELSRDEYIQVQAYRRYQHRLSVRGEPLHYVAMVARKEKDVSDELMETWQA